MTHTAVVVGGNRTPFVKAGGAYADASTQDLLTAAITGLVQRHGLEGERLGEVTAGAVLKHPRDFNLTREAVLSSPLSPLTPACDVQQACGTGLEAAIAISNKIRLGQIEAGIAGGVDSASAAPITVSEPLRRILMRAGRARTTGQRLAALAAIRPRHLRPLTPAVTEPRTGLSMGEHQALTTAAWGISRADQDALALHSHRALARAWDEGFFADLVTPFAGVERDGIMRPDTTAEALARLRPVFGGPEGTMTAGNSTALSDGAAVALIATPEWAAARSLTPWARIVDAEVAAVDHPGGDHLLLAPVAATGRLLERQHLTVQDMDLLEIHEAFAGTVLATLAAWKDADYCTSVGLTGPLGEIDPARLNVHGSSLATGHPFAATGGRLVATLAKELHARGPGTRGLISVCAAGGQGVVMMMEGL